MNKNNKILNETGDEELIITVNLENGQTMDCTVLTTFESQGKDYIALLPHDDKFQIHLFKYKYVFNKETGEEEGIELMNIYSELEYEAALRVFESLVEDYEELPEDEAVENY